MKLLTGNSPVTIDDKNRMLVPAEIRDKIDPATDGEHFYLVPGTNGKLWMYPDRYYESMASDIESGLAPDDDRLAFDQMMFGMAIRIERDKQGRVLIPEKVMRRSALSKGPVTVVGVKDHVEIWPPAEWEQREQELLQKRAEVAARGRQARLAAAQQSATAATPATTTMPTMASPPPRSSG